MSIRKATQESELGCTAGEQEIWKEGTDGFYVLDMRTDQSHFISEERLETFEIIRAKQGVTFKPMKGV